MHATQPCTAHGMTGGRTFAAGAPAAGAPAPSSSSSSSSATSQRLTAAGRATDGPAS